MEATTCCEQDASLALIWHALPFDRMESNAGVSTSTYSYDSNGNLTSGAGWGYTWDYLNRMLSSGFGGSTTTYAYDPAGNRVLQTSTTSTTFYPSKFYSLSSWTTGATTTATSTNYIWNGDTLLATIDRPMINGTATGTAITRYIHPDHLGSTNAVTDQNGNLVQLLDYYPFGATRVSTSTYPTSEKRDYIGQFNDAQTSLDYMNARYYNPTQGQFLSEDPVFWGRQNLQDPQSLNSSRTNGNALNLTSAYGENSNTLQTGRSSISGWNGNYLLDPQTQNPYSYGRDNPVSLSDPSGKFAIVPIALAALEIYGWASTGVDAYSAYNANRYPEGYTPRERVNANLQLGYDIATMGASGGLSKLGYKAAGVFIGAFQAIQDTYNSTPTVVQYYAAQFVSLQNKFQQYFSQTQPSNGGQGGTIRTYTTPSGAVVDANGKIISGPTKKQ